MLFDPSEFEGPRFDCRYTYGQIIRKNRSGSNFIPDTKTFYIHA